MTNTLKSICEQCVHLLNPQLDFIPEQPERHREIILRDLKELVSAASMEQSKTVVVLAGCIFEGVLYCFIQSQLAYIMLRRGGPFTFRPEHSLRNYVEIFNRYFSNVLSIPDLLVGYRDMVHINQELKYSPDHCRRAAEEMLRLLDRLLEKLAEYGTP
ncbi:MAG TPA: hypothetical protein VI636_11760 [Candidatus Angelobacter sp.]